MSAGPAVEALDDASLGSSAPRLLIETRHSRRRCRPQPPWRLSEALVVFRSVAQPCVGQRCCSSRDSRRSYRPVSPLLLVQQLGDHPLLLAIVNFAAAKLRGERQPVPSARTAW
jgi:hypothetical protein